MSALDAAMGRVAQTLVRTFGRPATLLAYGAPFYDPATGVTAHAGSPASISCHVSISEYDERQIDGTNIRRGDRKGIVAEDALGAEPVADRDKLVEGGRTWRIVRVRGYSSGAAEAAYELTLRL